MSKDTKKIIEEEVDRIVNDIPSKELKSVLYGVIKEDEQVLKSLMKSTGVYDNDNQITEENWKWFQDMLKQCCQVPRFQLKSKESNAKLYAVKYFTKVKFMIAESVEDEIKLDLKNYFQPLSCDDVNEFIETLFKLPFEFYSLVIRYVVGVLCPDAKDKLTPSLKEAEAQLKLLMKKKNQFIKNINDVSIGQGLNLSIADTMVLLDVKAFFDYNGLNVGCLEFLVRMLGSDTKTKLKEMFGNKEIDKMLQQILTLPSYLKHLQKVKIAEEQPYFNKDGGQNANREVTFNDLVVQYFNPEDYIPKPKSNEEPAQSEVTPEEQPQEQKPGNEVSAEQPSENALMSQ